MGALPRCTLIAASHRKENYMDFLCRQPDIFLKLYFSVSDFGFVSNAIGLKAGNFLQKSKRLPPKCAAVKGCTRAAYLICIGSLDWSTWISCVVYHMYFLLSHSQGTLACDKPQFFPILASRRRHRQNLEILYFGAILQTGSAKADINTCT